MPNIEEHDLFEDVWGDSSKTQGGSAIFRLRRTKNSPFRYSEPEERRSPPPFTFSTGRTKNPFLLLLLLLLLPPPTATKCQQVHAALQRSRSLDRSSTSKIGPKIEIGPLLAQDPKNQEHQETEDDLRPNLQF